MIDTEPNSVSPPPEAPKIFSENMPAFVDALQCLYIFDNLSGRLRFLADYPFAAHYIFPPDLIHCDQIGTKDKAQRLEFEKNAEENRQCLLDMITILLDKQDNNLSFVPADIEQIIHNLGRDISLYIFDIALVDRFMPEPPVAPDPPPIVEHIEQPTVQPTTQVVSPSPRSTKMFPNLAMKRNIIHFDPPGSHILSYQQILEQTENTTSVHPEKNQYSALFNMVAT